MISKFMKFVSVLALLSGACFAAPANVEPFDKSTWQSLVQGGGQRAVVIFTSVTCSHCPGAIAHLAAKRSSFSGPRLRLYVVSIDADDELALQRDPHYAPADRLFLFRGNSQVLEFSVNPGWRGMTPYVAFIDGRGGVKFSLGEPKDSVLSDWMNSAR